MYSFDGKVVDVSSTPFVIGQFTNATGPAVFDTYYNRVCFASFDSNGAVTFKRYNPNTFLLYDSLAILQAVGPVKSIITCGNGCYAFNTTDNKVIILKDSTLDTQEIPVKNNLTLYPNPTSNFLNVASDFEIKEIRILDVNGRMMSQFNGTEKNINLSNLQSGIYLAQIIDVNNTVTIRKIIKN